MEEKNRGFKLSGGGGGQGPQGNRARQATMVYSGDQAHRLRQHVESQDDAMSDAFDEEEAMPGVVEEPQVYGGESMAGGFDDTKDEAERQVNTGDDPFQSYEDIFDLPAEAPRGETRLSSGDSDPFDAPLEEPSELLESPEPPKVAPISVGTRVRPSSQVAPPPPVPVREEVPAMHEVHIPLAEAPIARQPNQGVAMTTAHEQIFWKADAPLVGFLVSYDHNPKGSYVELRTGRLIVSNQKEESGSCLMIPHESISPMHAIMRVAAGGVLQVLDQLSESGTRVLHAGTNNEAFLSGEKANVGHGDILFFGDRKFHVCLVTANEEE